MGVVAPREEEEEELCSVCLSVHLSTNILIKKTVKQIVMSLKKKSFFIKIYKHIPIVVTIRQQKLTIDDDPLAVTCESQA